MNSLLTQNYQFIHYASFFNINCFSTTVSFSIGSNINTTESSYEEDLNRATSTRGMILPRVYLVASDKLEPCVETNQVNSQSHIGLTVYNMTESADLKKGVYVWQGEEWLALMNDAPLGLGGWNDVETH